MFTPAATYESPEAVRQRQLDEGRRMSGTLGVSNPNHRAANRNVPSQRRFEGNGKPVQFGGNRPQGSTAGKHTPKGHDRILDGLMKSGNEFVVVLAGGENVRGRLAARDKYTVTVERQDKTRVTIFKHAIDMFFETAKVAEEV